MRARAAGLLLGVDGGNTKTIALVARPDGTVVGSGRVTGCGDPYAVGLDAALEVVMAAADEALRGTDTGDVDAAVFSLAGADWPEDFEELGAVLRRRWPSARVVNDGIGALRAAVPDGPGVAVALGTGAATGARGLDGQTWHSSFWQEPQGARELGVRTLLAIYRAELGTDPPTVLTDLVLARLGAPDVETVLHRATRRGPERWREPAILASTVLDAAEAGDPAAVAIVTEQGTALGRTALAAARRVAIEDLAFPLALTGGVLRHRGTRLPDAIVAAVHAGAPGARLLRPRLEPVTGALLLAFDDARIAVKGAIEERLLRSLPPDTLFDTHPGPPGT